jgi:hypothetical protein
MPRYVVERTYSVDLAGMPAVGKRSREGAQRALSGDRLGAQPRRPRRGRQGEVVLRLRRAEPGDRPRARGQLGEHFVDAIYEIAGDVTPEDFPLDGESRN